MSALIWILFVVAIVVIAVSLIMSPDSNSFSGALVGSNDLELFKVVKERGTKKILKWTMFSMGIVLIITSLIVRVFV